MNEASSLVHLGVQLVELSLQRAYIVLDFLAVIMKMILDPLGKALDLKREDLGIRELFSAAVLFGNALRL
jgi:hypothetical protein